MLDRIRQRLIEGARRLATLVVPLALIAGLSACGVTQGVFERTTELREEGLTLVRADLEEASRSAHAYEDRVAYTCYDELLAILDENGEVGYFTDASKGAISTFQKVRNTRRLLQGEATVRIRLACSALKEETQDRVGSVIGFLKGAVL